MFSGVARPAPVLGTTGITATPAVVSAPLLGTSNAKLALSQPSMAAGGYAAAPTQTTTKLVSARSVTVTGAAGQAKVISGGIQAPAPRVSSAAPPAGAIIKVQGAAPDLARMDEKISMAAKLLKESTLADKCSLAEVLSELAQTRPLPFDVTTFLISRLAAFEPSVAMEYPRPVLPGLVMKCDEFANIHVLKTAPPHPEVWNFRRTETAGLPIFGVGQCHLEGLAYLAKDLKVQGFNKVLWFNMREEPVVFLGGQCCAPRTAHNLNENVEYLGGIQGRELDAMERRLLNDCRAAAATSGGTLSVFYQVSGSENVEKLLPVSLGSSFSVREAYDWLNTQAGAAQITYNRVPIADETAPEEQDFDQLVGELKGIACAGMQKGTALVFNCQMGRGRTTTGMVCGSIMMLAAGGWKVPCAAPVLGAGGASGAPELPEPTAKGRNLKRGEFTSVLELLQLIDSETVRGRGLEAKLLSDQCCDDCGHAQNMVEAIIQCTEAAKSAEPGAARSPEFWTRRGQNYLERYAYIILFSAYALEQAPRAFQLSFSEWSRSHWKFKRIIKHLVLA